MIYLDIKGRLGNQLFQYAYARYLKEKTEKEICIKFQTKPKFGKYGQDGWGNSLEYFKTQKFKEYKGQIPLWVSKTSFFQFIFAVFFFILNRFTVDTSKISESSNKQVKWCPTLNKLGLFWLYNGYYNFNNYKKKNIFLKGNFESPMYFNAIRPILLEEFTPVGDVLPHNYELFDEINNTNSVCVSVRSFSEIQTNVKVSNLYNVCTETYFKEAIIQASEKIINPHFFIFSDNIEWAKKNLPLDGFKVTYETEENPVWEKLRLMYSCKHFILSNSTFSWWAQYLSRNDNKLVISPKKWFNDDFVSPLIDSNWIRI